MGIGYGAIFADRGQYLPEYLGLRVVGSILISGVDIKPSCFNKVLDDYRYILVTFNKISKKETLMAKSMRKLISVLIGLVLLSAVSGTPVPDLEAKGSGRPLRVVCTILPVYCLTLNVVGRTPGVQVELLLPAHQGCPHDYDMTPGDLIKLPGPMSSWPTAWEWRNF